MADNWKSPDTAVDAGEDWANIDNAKDDNEGTFAKVADLNPTFWTSFAELRLDSAINCDKIRILGNSYDIQLEETTNAYVDIDAYYDDGGGLDWQDIYVGTIQDLSWTEKWLVPGHTVYSVTKARVRWYNQIGTEIDAQFYEFDFNQVAVGIARPLVDGSLAAGKKGLV